MIALSPSVSPSVATGDDGSHKGPSREVPSPPWDRLIFRVYPICRVYPILRVCRWLPRPWRIARVFRRTRLPGTRLPGTRLPGIDVLILRNRCVDRSVPRVGYRWNETQLQPFPPSPFSPSFSSAMSLASSSIKRFLTRCHAVRKAAWRCWTVLSSSSSSSGPSSSSSTLK